MELGLWDAKDLAYARVTPSVGWADFDEVDAIETLARSNVRPMVKVRDSLAGRPWSANPKKKNSRAMVRTVSPAPILPPLSFFFKDFTDGGRRAADAGSGI